VAVFLRWYSASSLLIFSISRKLMDGSWALEYGQMLGRPVNSRCDCAKRRHGDKHVRVPWLHYLHHRSDFSAGVGFPVGMHARFVVVGGVAGQPVTYRRR